MLTTTQVSEILAVSQETVKKMINRGDIQGTKVAGRWRVDEAELERFKAYGNTTEGTKKVKKGIEKLRERKDELMLQIEIQNLELQLSGMTLEEYQNALANLEKREIQLADRERTIQRDAEKREEALNLAQRQIEEYQEASKRKVEQWQAKIDKIKSQLNTIEKDKIFWIEALEEVLQKGNIASNIRPRLEKGLARLKGGNNNV